MDSPRARVYYAIHSAPLRKMSTPLLLVGESTFNQNLFYKTRFLAGDPFLYVESGTAATLLVSAMELGRAQKESIVKDVRSFNDLGYVE